jgi:hypothetical protein
MDGVVAVAGVDPVDARSADHVVVVRRADDPLDALDRVVALTGRGPLDDIDLDTVRRSREVHGVDRALAADELVVAPAAGDDVPGPARAVDPVRTVVAREPVLFPAADDVLHPGEDVGAA